jgi:DNA modification methylase
MSALHLFHGDCLNIAETEHYIPPGQLALWSTPYPGLRGFDVGVDEYLEDWLPKRVQAIRGFLWEVTGVYAQVVKFPRREIDGASWFDTRIFEIPRLLEKMGFYIVDVYPWDKLNAPPSGNHKRHDRDAYEFVFVAAMSAGYTYSNYYKPYSKKSVAKARSGNYRKSDVAGSLAGGHNELNPRGAASDNVLRISSSGDQNRPRAKGGSFPRQLARRIIKQYSLPDDFVFDFCCGVGTTLYEAMDCGRNAIGIDIDYGELQVAATWLREVTDYGHPIEIRSLL